MRTPISTIIGAIDTIKDNETKLSNHNKYELFSEIEVASFRLNRQVENLLSMSRLEAGFLRANLDWCDVNELIFSVIKNNQDDAHDHIIDFEPHENLPLFKIDRILFEQVIHNIVHNALQHTPRETTIKIKIESLKDKCKIIISDNGPGFPENEIDFVFEKFYRLRNTATGGTGLGLSIAKGFTESMGGTIILENQKNGGAKFIIQIPSEIALIEHLDNE